ncbi:unnamed protein product [Peniophora sp. CBMAI 1063]|nr:unnamed protein product [Peniophora sp. CBMAI 1063]
MSPSKNVLRANVLRSIEDDHRRELKSRAGPIDQDLVAYRRRLCKRLGHHLRKDMQCFTDTPDDGRWFVECLFAHPGDVAGDGSIHIYVSRRLDADVLQELRDHMYARRVHTQQLLPSGSSPEYSARARSSTSKDDERLIRFRPSSKSASTAATACRMARTPHSGKPSVQPYPSPFDSPSRTLRNRIGSPIPWSSPETKRPSETSCIEIIDSDSDTTSVRALHSRSRSPSLEVLPSPILHELFFTVWLFMENSAPPQSLRLKVLPGTKVIPFQGYDRQWEKTGLKIADRVKVLAAYEKGEHLWQFGRLCDIRAPVSARAIVLSSIDVDRYHARLNVLVQHAFTGSFSHAMQEEI